MKFGSAEIHSLLPSAARIKAALEALTGGDRFQASAIQGLYPRMYRLNPVSFTGTTAANQQLGVITFPGGTFQDGDWLQISAQHSPRGASTGNCALIVDFIHSGGTTNLFTNTTNANNTRQVDRRLGFESSNINYHPDVANSGSSSTYPGSIIRTATDLAQGSSLRIAFTLGNAADVWWLNQFLVAHWRPVVL